ncbi:hypothetical protein F444_02790 [Phytophthora nicotianae P1976]|uniref:Uncharacterized protein n=1 Tax=Phytophthora nicotianae P1976 TaxID=1317066 RepID=A0A081AW67_PHYNI|nr:hypothetical protein F444_02790 [Phytophthora nicotianae P1976]
MENTPHLAFGVEMTEAGEEVTTMEEELERWALHDCSAIRDARGPDEMKRLFQRFRATRGKPVTVTPTVTIRSIDRAWTAFVKRELAGQVCHLSWDQDCRCCIAHFEDGCPHCREFGVA